MRKSVTVSIPEELLIKLDEYCKSNYKSRSQVLCSSFITVLNQELAISNLADLSKIVGSYKGSEALSNDDIERIKKFKNVYELLEALKQEVSDDGN